MNSGDFGKVGIKWACLGDPSGVGGHFRESLLGCTNYFSSVCYAISWVELSERPRSVGTFGRRERLLQCGGACTNTAAVAHRFFPAFLCFLSRFTRTQDSSTLVGLKFHFPYEDEGLCKTSAKASKLVTLSSIPLPPQRHCSKLPLQLEKITFSEIKRQKSSF